MYTLFVPIGEGGKLIEYLYTYGGLFSMIPRDMPRKGKVKHYKSLMELEASAAASETLALLDEHLPSRKR